MFTTSLKRKSAVMAMSIMFATAPFALAGNKPAATSSGQDQHYQPKMGNSTTSPASTTMEMQQQQAVSATVEEVNQEENRVSLRLDDGNTVEMQVPAAVVSDLQQGDSVEVSIRKSDSGQQSNMDSGQKSKWKSDGIDISPSRPSNPGSMK